MFNSLNENKCKKDYHRFAKLGLKNISLHPLKQKAKFIDKLRVFD